MYKYGGRVGAWVGLGRVVSDSMSAIAGRVNVSMSRVGSDRVQEKWPVDNSAVYSMARALSPWTAWKLRAKITGLGAPENFLKIDSEMVRSGAYFTLKLPDLAII